MCTFWDHESFHTLHSQTAQLLLNIYTKLYQNSNCVHALTSITSPYACLLATALWVRKSGGSARSKSAIVNDEICVQALQYYIIVLYKYRYAEAYNRSSR